MVTEAAMGSVGELWEEPQPMDPEAACGFCMTYHCITNRQVNYQDFAPYKITLVELELDSRGSKNAHFGR